MSNLRCHGNTTRNLHVCPFVSDVLSRLRNTALFSRSVICLPQCSTSVDSGDIRVHIFGSSLGQLKRRETLSGKKAEVKYGRCGPGAPRCGRKEAVQLVVASQPLAEDAA